MSIFPVQLTTSRIGKLNLTRLIHTLAIYVMTIHTYIYMLPDFFFFSCSADHERDWPPCKVVFFGLATNALNVRNNNFFPLTGGCSEARCIQIFL